MYISSWSGEKSHFIDWLRAFSMLRSPNSHISHSAVGPLKFNGISVPAAGNVLYIFIYKFYSYFFCFVVEIFSTFQCRLFTVFFKTNWSSIVLWWRLLRCWQHDNVISAFSQATFCRLCNGLSNICRSMVVLFQDYRVLSCVISVHSQSYGAAWTRFCLDGVI